jgi:GT2 family glycosyltransferase
MLAQTAPYRFNNFSSRKLCSIIIVSYNHARYLENCLRAVLATVGDDCEVIVLDNASQDYSSFLVQEKFPEVKLIKNNRNEGFAGGNNRAAKIATGKYLVALNPDTVVTPNWLEALLAPFAENPQVGLTTARILMLKQPDQINTCGNNMHYTGVTVCRGLRQNADSNDWAFPVEVAAISGACFAIRRELWEKLGGFDETFFTYLEDTDLAVRAKLHGYINLYVPSATIYHDYDDRFSPAKLFYLERNRLLLLLKTYRRTTLLSLSFALCLTELITWVYAFGRGRIGITAKLRAYGWLISHFREIKIKRQITQSLRRVSDKELLRVMSRELEISQVAGQRLNNLAKYTINPFYRFYFALITFFLGNRK